MYQENNPYVARAHLNKRDIIMYQRRTNYLLCPTSLQRTITLHKYQATEKKLEEIKAILEKKRCPILKLIIVNNQMNDKKVQILCDMILANHSLTCIQLTKCRMRNNQLSKICDAICSHPGNCMEEVQINQFSINKDGAKSIANMLNHVMTIKQLHLNDAGLDCDTLLEICNGLKDSMSLEHLDLRFNIFDATGLAGLINSLRENMSIKRLYMESMRIDKNEAQTLGKFFEQDDCMIEELVLNEADFDIETIDIIMEALYKADHLKSLSLSKNQLSNSICQHLSQIPKRLHHFYSLNLSHCEIGEDALKSLCAGFYGQTTVKNLNLSWNNISSQGMVIILDMLKDNTSLEKLLIQHNFLGESGAQQMAEALKLHPQMKYLDISANEIGSKGFLYFSQLFKSNDPLQNLHVRKNNIKGEEVLSFPPSLRDNSNLFYLDLKDNDIDNDCAKLLITLLHDNYFIEDLVLEGNNYIDQTIKETINEECRKNLLIKEFLLPHLTCKEGTLLKDNLMPAVEENHFKNYNVESLKLENMSFFRSDFISKFISMNRHDFHSLSLIKVHFDENIKDLANFLKQSTTQIHTLILNNCDIGDTSITQMITDCRKITTLKELRLISMHLSAHTKEILKSLQDHKTLKILDMSENGIQNMSEISALLKRNQLIQEVILSGNLINTAESFNDLLIGMANNISVINLKYDIKVGLLDERQGRADITKQEVEMISHQITMNKFVKQEIIPAQNQRKVSKTPTVDVSYLQVDKNIDAVVKYFSIQPHNGVRKMNLVLMACNITDQVALQLTGLLLNMDNFEIDLLDLSLNHISDAGCKNLTALFLADKKLKKLDLKHNIKIGNDGFKTLIKSIKKNTHISDLDLSICSIDLSGGHGWGIVLDDLADNYTLTSLNLEGNQINDKFLNLLDEELSQNKSITEIIIPSIKMKEEEKKEKEKKRRLSKVVENSQFNKFTSTGTVNLGKFGRKGGKNIDVKNLLAGDLENFKKPGGKGQTARALIDFDNFKNMKDKGADNVSSNASNYSSQSGSDTDTEQGKKHQAHIQKLTLRGKNLTSLDFLAKFMRVNPNIGDIDLGDNPLTDHELQKFTSNIMTENQAVRAIGMDGIKNLKSGTKTIINRELQKNQKIQNMMTKHMDIDTTKTLNLNKQDIQGIGFLQKFLKGYGELKILDLTDNRLGNRGAIEICQLIEETNTIEVLNLQNNRIGPSGLQHICSAMTVNTSIKHLDIRDNMIQDESLKILLAMLFRNNTIKHIKYSITNDENITRLKQFKEIQHLTPLEIENQLEKHDESHGKPQSLFAKICLPLRCWRSFIHDKHEAFRFKYDTKALNIIEDELMDKMTYLLYLNSFVYYLIMFICPITFVEECGQGYNVVSHYIYGVYSIITIIMEITFVLQIQKRVQNKNILQFNKWHFVELFMGQIARFDTYLDVCFLSLLWQCKEWYLVIPIGSLICLYILYPLYKLFRLMKIKKSFNHTLPKIERNCDICFIRENMLLATVLDSFCIENNIELCKKPIAFGRIMGIWTLLTQDGPQYLIHLIFLFTIHNDVSHSETTVVMSLIVSTFAIQISVFNCIMCAQNEFDPILLQLELKRRKEEANKKEDRLRKQKQNLRKRMSLRGPIGIEKKSTLQETKLKIEKKSTLQEAKLNSMDKNSNQKSQMLGNDMFKSIQGTVKSSSKNIEDLLDKKTSPRNKYLIKKSTNLEKSLSDINDISPAHQAEESKVSQRQQGL